MVNRPPAISLLAIVAMLIATISVTSQTRTLSITRVNVIDVVGGRIVPNGTVTISGDTIRSVTQNAAPPAGARVVDGRGRFLLPGLWDMHAHVWEIWLPLYVANGVTAARDMGNDLDTILRLRAETASGRTVGPRIFTAGVILDNAPGDWPLRMRVKTAADGTAAVQLLKTRGVDLIKVHDNTPRDAFFAIAEEARRQNLPLAGHIPSGLTVEQVIEAGQRDIEHLSNSQIWKPCSGGAAYQPAACRSFFDVLARRGIWQTPTIFATSEVATVGTSTSQVSAEQLAYVSKDLRDGWAGNQSVFTRPGVIESFRTNAAVGATVTKDMARAGVRILTGCDMMIAGFCVHDELAAMVRGGMTPLEALQTATLNPARYFGLEQKAGSVAAGRRADLLLLEANPLIDIANTRRIRAVAAAGRWLDRDELDKLLADVKNAARKTPAASEMAHIWPLWRQNLTDLAPRLFH